MIKGFSLPLTELPPLIDAHLILQDVIQQITGGRRRRREVNEEQGEVEGVGPTTGKLLAETVGKVLEGLHRTRLLYQ